MVSHVQSTGAREMDPCPGDDRIAQLLEGRLDEDAMRALDDHFDRCAVCTAVLRELGLAFAEKSHPDAPATDTAQRYRVIERIGAGAEGVVYLALDTALRRRVALKIVRPELLASHDGAALRDR